MGSRLSDESASVWQVVQVVNEVEVGGILIFGGTRIACLYFICTYIYMLLISCQQQKGHVLCHDNL